MGRYAFFNTGLEYKFAFGIQDSLDMTKFEGSAFYGRDEDHLIHKWDKIDAEKIKEKLKEYLYDEIDFSKYTNNLDGTYNLKFDLHEQCSDYEYILGCIIYHQLQYVDNLEVNYEL
jgi:formate-dependent nitrite reductase cytochrome c552 subunit